MLQRKIVGTFLLCSILLPTVSFAQVAEPTKTIYTAPKSDIDKIKDEGLNRSQIMQHLSYLTDVIGPRLTGSPNIKRANEWTRDIMAKWGMQNAKLEVWGPFGRGWSLKSFSAQVVDPQTIPLIAYPKAWSPSTKGAVTAEVVFLDLKTDTDLAKYKGQLRGKIVLTSGMRELKADFGGMAVRHTDDDLSKLAAAPDPAAPQPPMQQGGPRQAYFQNFVTQAKRMNFLVDEGVVVIVDNSSKGSGGTVFVSGASVAVPVPEKMEDMRRLRPWLKEFEPRMVPQMTMATEDYNRLIRMINQGAKLKMTVDIQVEYQDEDLMGYNTVAEISGTDPKLKEELVILGGHLDSWHSSTGATDNAAGCIVAMEAARILIATGLKPRRTIRVGLWSGEEYGLNGSRGHVKQHFGEPKDGGTDPFFGPRDPNSPQPEVIKRANYDKLSAYYNLDGGAGRIRGVFMQGNAAVRPYFEAWLAPFADMGAKFLTMSNTGGTDHLPFDAIGLPGFAFIQDRLEYDTRTHHSNQDNYDRIQADDMKQAAIIMAAFVYQTAMMDEKIPRKVVK